MKQSLAVAEHALLAPTDLTVPKLQQLLHGMLSRQLDLAELYFQSSLQERWQLEDGQIKEGAWSQEQGVGVRAISGEKTGYAYSNDISFQALAEAAGVAQQIAKLGHTALVQVEGPVVPTEYYQPLNPLTQMSAAEKIALLQQADRCARQMDSRIVQVDASLSGSYDVVLVMDHQGLVVADIRPLVRLDISVLAEHGKTRERGHAGAGGRYGYDIYQQPQCVDRLATMAVEQALTNLQAVAAPAGTMPVVLGPGWPGILLHEAVGHGLEGDFNRKKLSAFSGCLNQRVAAPGVTVIDDGSLVNRRGSLHVDDEGTPTQRTVLIEDGILKGYMCDKLNARLLGLSATGNGRRESYAHVPMPRMTNTFMLAGPYNPEDIIASVDKGIYAVNFGGGQVDITSGEFVFSANEAYLIERGRVTQAIKGATLIGCGKNALQHISMIGNDLALDEGIGTCGKEGQSVPVGVGQPTLKIDRMTVGGTQV